MMPSSSSESPSSSITDLLPHEILASIASYLTTRDKLQKFATLNSEFYHILNTQSESALDLREHSSTSIFEIVFGRIAVRAIILDDNVMDSVEEHLPVIASQIRTVRMICLSGDNGREYFERATNILSQMGNLEEIDACFSSFVSKIPDAVNNCFKMLSQKVSLKTLSIEGALWWKQKIMPFPHLQRLEKADLTDFENLDELREFIGDVMIPHSKWPQLKQLQSLHLKKTNKSMKSLSDTLQHGRTFVKSVCIHLHSETPRESIIQVVDLMPKCENLRSLHLVFDRKDRVSLFSQIIVPRVGVLIKDLMFLRDNFNLEDVHKCTSLHTLALSMSDIQQNDVSSKPQTALTHLTCPSVKNLSFVCTMSAISLLNLLKWIHCFPNANWHGRDIGIEIIISQRMHQQNGLVNMISLIRYALLDDDKKYYRNSHKEWINRECLLLEKKAQEYWTHMRSQFSSLEDEWQNMFYLEAEEKQEAEQEATEQFLENLDDVIYPLKYLCWEYVCKTLYGNISDFTE